MFKVYLFALGQHSKLYSNFSYSVKWSALSCRTFINRVECRLLHFAAFDVFIVANTFMNKR